ncbi:MAG: hypothetical protein H6974_12910 [Gammaproteobacteria bacterium]|nr:hypothetical protein [Gammaproteobacteria bacterium]
MAIFDGIDLTTLTAWLSDAQVAYNDLSTGQQVVSLRQGDNTLSFTAAEPGKLKQYILDLQAAMAKLTGAPRRRKGVYLVGGKGV